jgi:inner membrane protein
MASIFSHGYLAFCIGKGGFKTKFDKKIIFTGIFLAILPDFDIISFAFGIPYESVWGHRGFTHSILFAAIISLLSATYFYKSEKTTVKNYVALYIFFFLSIASHSILDALTTGGMGVGFFIPFDNSRYFFSYRPILVSPIGVSNFFSSWGAAVILSELKTVGVVGILILIFGFVRNKVNLK